MAIAISLGVWTIVNTLLDYGQYEADAGIVTLTILNMLGFFTALVSLNFVYRLTFVFPAIVKKDKFSRGLILAANIFPLLAFVPFVSGSFYHDSESQFAVYQYGSGVVAVGLVAALMCFAGIQNIARSFRLRIDNQTKSQARIVYGALLATVVLAVLFITVLPLIVKDPRTITLLGYYVPFIFSFAIFYSLLRQNFLDFRQIIARSIGYMSTVLFVGSVFAVFSFLILDKLFFKNSSTTVAQAIGYAIVSITMAITFRYTVAFFNTLSNRVFYREAYDPQKFLNSLSAVLVKSIEVKELITNTEALLRTTFHIDEMVFAVFEKDGLVASSTTLPKGVDLHKVAMNLSALFEKGRVKYYLTDEREKSNLLQGTPYTLSMPLRTREQKIGVFVAGPKISGSNYTSDDIALLNIATDQMSLALQNALRFEEIQKFNITLQQKIDDATRQLRRTNEKLKALDETKDEFISMASHQLRTPLTSVKGYVSMVLEGDAGKITKQQRALLDQAFLSSQRMVYLIADLLNVSRLRTGKFIIEAKPTQLVDVIEGEIQQLEEAAKSKNMTLTYHRPKDFPMLNLDETKIRQVIMNFADNALYYTPAGGQIDIFLVDKGQSIEFTVVDNGIGVPVREQHHLFTKFYRANNAQKARPDGTGLGLFMAKKVVVAQGGAIIFRSEEGKGSTFGFSFPKKVLLESALPKK
jgi:signal transduction histidine kinase